MDCGHVKMHLTVSKSVRSVQLFGGCRLQRESQCHHNVKMGVDFDLLYIIGAGVTSLII